MHNVSFLPSGQFNAATSLATEELHLFDHVLNQILFSFDQQHNIEFFCDFTQCQLVTMESKLPLSQWLLHLHSDDRENIYHLLTTFHTRTLSHETTRFCFRWQNAQGGHTWYHGKVKSRYYQQQLWLVGSFEPIQSAMLPSPSLPSLKHVQNTDTPYAELNLYPYSQVTIDLNQALNSHELHVIHLHFNQLDEHIRAQELTRSDEYYALFSKALSTVFKLELKLYLLREGDIVILLPDLVNQSVLDTLLERLHFEFKHALPDKDRVQKNLFSVGVYPHCQGTHSPEHVLQKAANACYYNSQVTSLVTYYQDKSAALVERYCYVKHSLKQAIAHKDLYVKFQPIFCSQSESVCSFETLVRWRSDQHGEIYPDEFIGEAERQGLISPLGEFVFQQACRFLQSYRQRHSKVTRVNVNVSVLQLLNSQLPTQFYQLCQQHHLTPSDFVLEITESVSLDHYPAAIEQLGYLATLGFQLSLDDFGAGLSSINSFFDLPFHQLKVDKEFAEKALNNSMSSSYLHSLINLCHQHQVQVVVEGIENAKMKLFYQKLGANYLQGYWFSKPLSMASASGYDL
ncbi:MULTISPECIES: EAL domain-containing protein [unclassified Vibrio]|uniref:EAL domain-containing protein n=1 Tax=Vibrio sp. HB236076 TaxID=3232307 RepID=A0AB39HBK7_9VIBR|nr:EAL domain-containing protein [Vibrio sp. HB161653]MDP5253493.1 EAL domain-containing protein [Vibrio sp. HB161653]